MLTTDRVAGAALALLALGVLLESRRLPLGTLHAPGPAFVPVVLGVILLGLGAALVATGGAARRLQAGDWPEWRHAAAILAAGAFAALALERLGYRLTVGAMLVFLLGVVERRGVVTTLVVAAGLAAGSFFLFDTLLRVQLPRGPLGL